MKYILALLLLFPIQALAFDTTLTHEDLTIGSQIVNDADLAQRIFLPSITAGDTTEVLNPLYNKAITICPEASDRFIYNGVLGGLGYPLVSGGTAEEHIKLNAIDDTRIAMDVSNGSWILANDATGCALPVPPLLSSFAVDGSTWTFNYDQVMTTASTDAELCTDYDITMSTAGLLSLTYAGGTRGTDSVFTCTGSSAVVAGETITDGLNYTQGTVQANDDNILLASFTDRTTSFSNDTESAPFTIGLTTVGDTAVSLYAADRTYANSYLAAASGTIQTGHLYNNSGSTGHYKVCVYNDAGTIGVWDTGDTLISCSAQIEPTSNAWGSGAMSGSIVSGQNYWVAALVDQVNVVGYKDTTTGLTSRYSSSGLTSYTSPVATLEGITNDPGGATQYSLYITVQ